MKTFKSKEELGVHLESLKQIHNLIPFKQKGYLDSYYYECGCGSEHQLNGKDGSVSIGRESRFGANAVFRCENDWLTHVEVKGVFVKRFKVISLWSAPYSFMHGLTDELDELLSRNK